MSRLNALGGLVSTVAGLGLAVAAILAGCKGAPLQVTVARCSVLHTAGASQSCDLPADHRLSVLVVTPAAAEVSCDSDRGAVPIRSTRAVGDERVLEIELPPGATRLAVSASDGLRRARVSLTLREQAAHEPLWLTQARQLWEKNNRPREAEELLRQHLGDAVMQDGTSETRAQVLGLQAAIATERNDNEAGPLLDRAVEAARAAQVPSLEARFLLRKAWFLADEQHQFDQAKRLLIDNEPLFRQVPEQSSWRLLQLALLQQSLGNLTGALAAYTQAEKSTELFGGAAAVAELAMARAETLVLMGRLGEAQKLMHGVADSVPDLCRRGKLLTTQGWLHYLARQTLRREDHRWSELNPVPPLDAAVKFLQDCEQPADLANAMTNLAHVAVDAREALVVQHWLERAKKALPDADAKLALEWAELDGQLALWRKDFPSAMTHYERLADLGKKGNQYEAVWMALIGQAQAAQALQPMQAADLYAQAETYLDQRSLEMPLAAGRGTFLGRFERGTALYVDLLVSLGRSQDAIRVIRHARARGLWALAAIARATALSDSQRRVWEQALSNYRGVRRQLDETAAAAANEAIPQRQELEREQPQRIQELLAKLDTTLHELEPTPVAKDFRAPQPGELMLTCHPRATTGWHCFVWGDGAPQRLFLERMDEAHMGAALAEARDKLDSAQRLHVIAYGEMRKIEIHQLARLLSTQPLDERLAVDYALDLPMASVAAAARAKKALVILDPQGNVPYSRRTAGPIMQAMQQTGWDVVAHSVAVPRLGNYPGKPAETAPVDNEQLRTLLGQVSLFHYGGHSYHVSQGGWLHRLWASEGPGFLLADILTLPDAPERVLLFACNTGVSAEESGAIEGLGLAQAFLLRGSHWVIATMRPVADRVAADLALAIYRHSQEPASLLGSTPDPESMLRTARGEVLAATPDPEHRLDLASFRVFRP